ncbi:MULTISPECIES: class I SAM-dependent methyltransferase [Niallia]|jgi:16S rRNA (guanine1207-N2)-methyltransferase|uniref:16S rRNA methyltransferase n=1 Tax=Niallia circulans TaxID=1397 RepID=A0AA91TNH4_NIACI|nr:class I SAM-dependent methyltransferase [Niallia circulans]NRG27569.1 class I SAM-dependent methyltransferase [Niallia circulans]PAD81077.1 16S rRNA methyltransferase [Niallia circulans]QJX60327.1 class I SAM-dependent methyltransferase [Niallia circulans]
MTEHYYSRTQNVNSDPNYWNFTLKGNTIRFKTDNGVFSKKEVDFGSRLLIETYTLPDLDGDILDVGCGYGPIGISIAKTSPNRMVHMVDVNLRAIELAEENARQNGVENVRIYESDRLLRAKGQKFASILTNPPIRAGKKVVHDIFEQSYECLVPNGELWVVIQKKQGAPSAIAKLEEFFKEVNIVEKKKGYFIIQAKKID